MALPYLNRRHKIGLLAVLAGTGIALILDASAKQTAGLVLIGLAGTWLVAGLSHRALRLTGSILLIGLAFVIAVYPILTDWNAFRASVKDYDGAIVDLRQAIGNAGIGSFSTKNPEPVTHGPWENYRHTSDLPTGFFDRPTADQFAYLARTDPDFSKATLRDQQAYVYYLRESSTVRVQIPENTQRWAHAEWVTTAIDFPARMTSEEIIRAFQDHGLQPRPNFSLWHSVRSHQGRFFGGTVLAVFGVFGSVWKIRRKP